MKDTLFVQFYSKIENTNPRFKGHSIYELCNGFSDTYDLCKEQGDFYWVNHSKQLKGFGNDKKRSVEEIPINKGTVYVSVYYLTQLYQVYTWANRYPGVFFIVGGPAANCNVFHVSEDFMFPINMKLTNKTVEEYFGHNNFSYKWNLEIPDDDESMTLSYTYTLSSRCYWGKCIFCNYSQGSRSRNNIGFEFKNLEYGGKQRINLYTPSMTSKQLETILYNLDYNNKIRYDIYLRGNDHERKTLKNILENKGESFPQVKFIVGTEFPSNKMLKYINKNVTVDDITETIEMIAEYGDRDIQIQLPFILGWNNLDQYDIDELRTFLEKLPYEKIKITFSANLLTAKINTPVYYTYKRWKELYVGPFYYGFEPYIDEQQMNYSKQAIELMFQQGVTVFDYHNIRGK